MIRSLPAFTMFAALVPATLLAATPAPLHADRDRQAISRAQAACTSDDFDSFIVHLASAPDPARRIFYARSVEVKTADSRKPGQPSLTVRHVAGPRYAGFPLAMFNHHFVLGRGGRLAPGTDGAPQYLVVESERQTAILTEYPVRVVTVSWRKIRYEAPAPGEHEGRIAGADGDSGRLVFAATGNCWELIDSYTTLQSDTMRQLDNDQ